MEPTGVRNGFDPEDVRQEGAMGILQAEKERPGDKGLGRDRARRRIARHRRKEANHHGRIIIPVSPVHPETYALQYEMALAHEILDLLPYAIKEDVLKRLQGDGRELRVVGRIVREALPGVDL